MKAIVVIDNRSSDQVLIKEHGLSIYVETNAHKCLVDVGLSDAFISNTQQLGIALEEIDYLFLSHAHVDHTGGLSYFLKINDKAKIIVSDKLFEQQYFSTRTSLLRDISPNVDKDDISARLVEVNSDTVLEKDIRVIVPVEHPFSLPKGNNFLFKKNSDKLVFDDFNHEIIPCFGKQELFVCSGCAHNGLLNILEAVCVKTGLPITYVIGGFHLLDSDENHHYESTKTLLRMGADIKKLYPLTRFYTGHCTGDKTFKILKKSLGDQLDAFYTGLSITI